MLLYEISLGPLPDFAGFLPRAARFIQSGLKIPDDVYLRPLILRCCSKDPKDRPSLDDIWRWLENCNFKIFSDVDSQLVKCYISYVRETVNEGNAKT
jgi:hypothetical protein